MIIRMSVVNFETVLTVGWGCHEDFLQVGNLDWLFEGEAGFEQWKEGVAMLEQEQQQKQKAQEVDSQKISACPGLEAVGKSHGERVLEESFVPACPVAHLCGVSSLLNREQPCPQVVLGNV